jgi:signal transduction histidine kinase/CheY-like chemotaxis protein
LRARLPLVPWVPWLVLLVFGGATVAGTTYIAQTVLARDQLRFQNATQDFRTSLQARIDTYVAMLRAASALFAASDRVTRDEFHAFVEHLDLQARFPGIQGIGFAQVATPDTLPALEAEMQQQGAREFRVWPSEPRRSFYTSIVFLEPLDVRNQAALGYDMFTDATRRAAMEAARNTGTAVASGKVVLVQEIDPGHQQAGFLIYLPVYLKGPERVTVQDRVAGLAGFVYAAFRAGDLLGTLLRGDQQHMLTVRIYDGESAARKALLYDSAPDVDFAAALLQATVPLRIAERPWTVAIAARPEFGGGASRLLSLIFVLGLLVSVLLFVLTRAEAAAREVAEGAADALRRSEEDLRTVNRAKDEFLATLSHELRTPLNAILGWAHMLRTGQLSERRRTDALTIIERNARTQARLIEDLLDVSRIITGKLRLDLRLVPLNPALDEAVSTVRPAADAKGVTLVWTPDAAAGTIYAAPERLQQIVWNLLSNAIKFTPAGGRVELYTTRSPTDVHIVVRDTGAGIASSFLPHVFERFRQGDSSTTRTHSGVGLGLAIVRHLVELHGGMIEAASEGSGLGATFTVTLPVPRADASAGADQYLAPALRPSAEHPGRLVGTRVLVVDDEPDARELARDALSFHGAAVETAHSVDEALQVLDQKPFDVVVTDLAMPGADGFALVRRLREGGPLHARALPVIAVSAYARGADRDRVLAEGFQGYLGKPLEFEQLMAMIAHVSGKAVS